MVTNTFATEKVSVKVDIEKMVYVVPAGTETFDDATTAACYMLEIRVQLEHYSVYNTAFQKTAPLNGDAIGNYLSNTRLEHNRNKYAHEFISKNSMQQFAESFENILKRWVNVSIFFSSCKLRRWYPFLGARQEQEEEHDEGDPYITIIFFKRFFTVDQRPFNFVHANENCISTTSDRSLIHISMVEIAVHLRRNVKRTKENLKLVNYSRGSFVPSPVLTQLPKPLDLCRRRRST